MPTTNGQRIQRALLRLAEQVIEDATATASERVKAMGYLSEYMDNRPKGAPKAKTPKTDPQPAWLGTRKPAAKQPADGV